MFAPVAAFKINVFYRSAKATFAVKFDETTGQGLTRKNLQFRLECGAHGVAAFAQVLLCHKARRGRVALLQQILQPQTTLHQTGAGNGQWLGLRFLHFRFGDVAIFLHLQQHPVPALDGALGMAEWIVVVRSLWQRRQIGHFVDRNSSSDLPK